MQFIHKFPTKLLLHQTAFQFEMFVVVCILSAHYTCIYAYSVNDDKLFVFSTDTHHNRILIEFLIFLFLVRVVFTVVDVWKPEFEDRGSEEFKNFDRTFSSAVEELYAKNTNDVNNQVFAKVVQIR